MSRLVMSVAKTSIIIVCIGLFSLASHAAHAKSYREKKQPLAAIPSPLRMQLLERLKLLIEYQGERKWEKMYDIVAPSTLHGISREQFVREQESMDTDPDISTLVDFIPEESILTSKSEESRLWMLFGCADYKRHGKLVHIKAGLSAELYSHEWFFSEISTVTQVDGPEEPCQYMTKGRKDRRGRHR